MDITHTSFVAGKDWLEQVVMVVIVMVMVMVLVMVMVMMMVTSVGVVRTGIGGWLHRRRCVQDVQQLLVHLGPNYKL